jgi:hypothetical protein
MAARNARNEADPGLRAREMDWVYDHDVATEFGDLGD